MFCIFYLILVFSIFRFLAADAETVLGTSSSAMVPAGKARATEYSVTPSSLFQKVMSIPSSSFQNIIVKNAYQFHRNRVDRSNNIPFIT